MRTSVEAASKKISSLTEADDRLLAKAVRAGLSDAVDELADQVERLRARLRKTQRRSMSVAR
jgi:ubiquinone biosynthesis protein UbiJ